MDGGADSHPPRSCRKLSGSATTVGAGAHYPRLPVELFRFATTERAKLNTAVLDAIAELLEELAAMLTDPSATDRRVYSTLAWGGAPEAGNAERFALESLATYPAAIEGGSFRNEAHTRCVLAVARVARGEADGAAEALSPVLALPPAQRDHTILTLVARVQTALSARTDPGREATALTSVLEAFALERLTTDQKS